MKRAGVWLLIVLALVLPRVLFLDADAAPDLCWGTGIWTDEGFYTHNARNAVLFGHAELDGFNNRNLSPVLDLLQQGVFRIFGVGLVPVRALSAFFGLLALVFFYDGLRRKLGRRIALTATLFLGFEPTYLFYNRLALMEAPAVCVVCAALWAWCVGGARGTFLAGFLAASLVAWKASFLLFAPLPILAAILPQTWGPGGRNGGKFSRYRGVGGNLLPYALGAVVALLLYYFLWFRPHEAAIVHMNRHYAMEQARPKSFMQLLWMVRRAGIGYYNGLFQRLFTRDPALSLLAVAGLFAPLWSRRKRGETLRILYLWTAVGILWISVSKYAPTRYYLVFWPALCGLAAVMLWRLPLLKRKPLAVAVPVGLLAFHALQPVFFAAHDSGWAVGVGLVVGVAAGAGAWRLAPRLRARSLRVALVGLFALASALQIGFYFATKGHRTKEIGRELTRIAAQDGKPDAMILGDWAPNFVVDTPLHSAPVFQKLANDDDPVGTLHADYILTSDDKVHAAQWRHFAPLAYRPENRVAVFPLYQYTLELYRVGPLPNPSPHASSPRRSGSAPLQPLKRVDEGNESGR